MSVTPERIPDAPTRLADPVEMEVFSNRLMSIVEGMLNILVRSSFSTNIKERRDCSVGLFDAEGRVLAQTEHTPLHLGSTLGAVQTVLDRIPRDQIRPGDAFICNDPYLAGGTHLPDITIVSPVFAGGELALFVANIAHHADVGGLVPGSIAGSATSVFQEGIRIPLVRICDAGRLDTDLLDVIVTNTRDPGERRLDLGVQVATNERGVEMAKALAERMGIARLRSATADLLAYTERRLAMRIAALAPIEGRFSALLDDDGLGGDPVTISAAVRVVAGRLVVDFTGTGGEARGAMNVPTSALRATVSYVVKMMLDPGLMANQGALAPLEVIAPEGTIVNPRHPAAVGARSITANKIARAVIGALTEMLPPDRGIAAGQDIVPGIVFAGHRRRGDPYVYLETVGGGSGATASVDGMDGVQVHVTNTSNLPAEALETEYRLRVDAYELVDDSAGAGTFRGGLGIARQIRALEDGVVFSARSDGHVNRAPGLRGGLPGRRARLVLNPGRPDERELDSKTSNLLMRNGDAVRLETPGGGGLGEPGRRADAAILADLLGGKTSRAAADAAYGADRVARLLGDV